MSKTPIALIVAMDKNGIIGKDGKLPWHFPKDLQWFKEQTMGNPILMGRKTYDSIGRPLPGRSNMVLSRNSKLKVPKEVLVFDDPDKALEVASQMCFAEHHKLFVIGGAEVFRIFLPKATLLYLSRIDASFDGDTRFPELDFGQWQLIQSQVSQTPEGIRIEFQIYERI